MNFVTAKEVKEKLHISGVTLMRWKNEGRIKSMTLSTRKVLYDLDSIIKDENKKENKLNVIYGRVSTPRQKTDLNNQIELIKQYMLSNGIGIDEIYSDIASGLNEKRIGFNHLLESVFKREIDTVYITFKDRLSRFGCDYFTTIFAYFGTKIVVLDQKEETNKTYQQELTEDLISIIRNYSTKIYDEKKKKLKNIEKLLSETENEEIQF
jgi:predicted site-specific integrase-resolvase